MITLSTILFVLILIAVFIVIWIFWAAFIGAGWEPTSMRRVRKMLEMAEVNSKDIVYDLGSGDGRIVTEAAKKYHAKAVGIEADPIRVFWSRLTILRFGLRSQAKIIWGNFFKQNISEATVVTLFLSDYANEKLKSKFLRELKPGTRIVSYIWVFEGWNPVRVNEDKKIFLYVIGQSNPTIKNRNYSIF